MSILFEKLKNLLKSENEKKIEAPQTKKSGDKLKIGYYHTLKDIIDKEKGIKTNYLNNHLYYKLK